MPALGAKGLADGLAERDAHVLDRVVGVDVQIARRRQREIEAAVPREQLEHVVEEPDAGAHVIPAAAVDLQAKPDVRSRWSFD